MIRPARAAAAVFLAAAVLAVLGLHAGTPILYSRANESGTASHVNVEALAAAPEGRAGELLPLMEDLLNQTGTIVLTIRTGDLDTAERQLAEIVERSRYFDTLVVNLEATDGSLGEFRTENRENVAALRTLYEQSRQMESLQKLEIRYRDEKNPGQLYAVTYEGEALRLKMQENYERYASHEDAVLDVAKVFDLSTASYEASVEAFSGIADRSTAGPEGDPGTFGSEPFRQLGLSVAPQAGIYRDRLVVSGRLSDGPAADRPVTVLIDGRPWSEATTRQDGRFSFLAEIGGIPAGRHLVYARIGEVYSNTVTIQIMPVPSSITLSAVLLGNGTHVECRGELAAGGEPVAGAPVSLDDGARSYRAVTGAGGAYLVQVPVEPGVHEFSASFGGGGFPLDPSRSETVTIVVEEPAPVGALIAGAGLVLLAAAGSSLYLRRGRRRAPAAAVAISNDPAPAAPRRTSFSARLPAPDAELKKFDDALVRGSISEALRGLYLALVDRLALRLGIHRHRSLTPREIAALAPPGRPSTLLRTFVERYERMRYAGQPLHPAEVTACAGIFRELTEEGEGT